VRTLELWMRQCITENDDKRLKLTTPKNMISVVRVASQEAQLLQRDRAVIRVIEVTQDHSRSFEMTLLSRTCVCLY